MAFCSVFLWALPLSVLFGSGLGSAALASTIGMELLPLNGPAGNCPERLIAYQTSQPPAPGGYATDGMIQLAAIATNITPGQRDDFSAVWLGTLKPEYRGCEASAGISVVDGQTYTGHSYLRVQLANGQARVILDMTGMRDANGFTSAVIEQTMRSGNPRWAWGGTD